jgi:hypothetical protein
MKPSPSIDNNQNTKSKRKRRHRAEGIESSEGHERSITMTTNIIRNDNSHSATQNRELVQGTGTKSENSFQIRHKVRLSLAGSLKRPSSMCCILSYDVQDMSEDDSENRPVADDRCLVRRHSSSELGCIQ